MIFFVIQFIFLLFYYFQIDFYTVDVSNISLFLSIVFISSAVYYLKKFRKGFIMSFELIFFVVFFFVTYTYSLFAYDKYEMRLILDVSHATVVKSVYISTLGFLAFLNGAALVGIPLKKETSTSYETTFTQHVPYENVTKILNYITLIILILFFVFEGKIVASRYNEFRTIEASDIFLTYLRILIIISTAYEFIRLLHLEVNTFSLFMKNVKKIYLFNTLIPGLFYVIIGFRSEFLTILLTVFFAYIIFIRNIKLGYLLLGFLVGFLLLGYIKFIRGFNDVDVNQVKDMGGFTFLGFISEFFYTSFTLFELTEFTDLHGCTYGSNIILQIFSFVPFLQSLVVFLFKIDINAQEIATSSTFISDYILGVDRGWGLGTHVIGDLYYSFGLPGVIVLMFLLGFIISKLTKKIVYDRKISLPSTIILLVFFSQSFFLSRVEFFRPVRDIGFILFIYLIIQLSVSKKNYETERVIDKEIE